MSSITSTRADVSAQRAFRMAARILFFASSTFRASSNSFMNCLADASAFLWLRFRRVSSEGPAFGDTLNRLGCRINYFPFIV